MKGPIIDEKRVPWLLQYSPVMLLPWNGVGSDMPNPHFARPAGVDHASTGVPVNAHGGNKWMRKGE
jgi:hypothetical protein